MLPSNLAGSSKKLSNTPDANIKINVIFSKLYCFIRYMSDHSYSGENTIKCSLVQKKGQMVYKKRCGKSNLPLDTQSSTSVDLVWGSGPQRAAGTFLIHLWPLLWTLC